MSNKILAEMKKMIVLTARREMLSNINSSQYFALTADEGTDISKKEQLSVSFAQYSVLMKSEKISLEFCLALMGYQLMPFSNTSPMFSFDAKLMAKSLLQ